MRVESSSHQDFSTMSTTYKAHTPADIATGEMDADYDYSAPPLSPAEKAFHDYQLRGEPPPPPPPPGPPPPASPPKETRADGVEDALLDLAQLEELHQEAERMKALGNKHMAAQVSLLRISCSSPATILPCS